MAKNKKRKKQGLIGLFVSLLLLGAVVVGGLFVLKTMEASYQLRIEALQEQIDSNTKAFYVAATDIKYGEVITQDMLRGEIQLLGYPADAFTLEDIGSVAVVDIPAGTIMLKPMCEALVKDVSEREVEFSCFYVGQNIVVGDYIDIRIRFQTGEDFVVLPKKRIERLSLTNSTCFLMVNELELQRMASAIVDVSEYNAVMYCNVYPQPELQAAAEVNYPVRTELNSLMLSLAEQLGIDYMDNVEKRTVFEEGLNKSKSETGTIIDVSNLTGYSPNDKSNTNGNGTSISSDYTGEESHGEEGLVTQ